MATTDEEWISAFLGQYPRELDDHYLECRLIHQTEVSSYTGKARSYARCFRIGDLRKHPGRLTRYIRERNEKLYNVFICRAPRLKTRGFTRYGRITHLTSLILDLDGISVEDALALIAKAGLPKPSLVVSSGYGVHLYWYLREPLSVATYGLIPLINISRAFYDSAIARGLLSKKQGGHLDEACFDLTRILRAPGSKNLKPIRVVLKENTLELFGKVRHTVRSDIEGSIGDCRDCSLVASPGRLYDLPDLIEGFDPTELEAEKSYVAGCPSVPLSSPSLRESLSSTYVASEAGGEHVLDRILEEIIPPEGTEELDSKFITQMVEATPISGPGERHRALLALAVLARRHYPRADLSQRRYIVRAWNNRWHERTSGKHSPEESYDRFENAWVSKSTRRTREDFKRDALAQLLQHPRREDFPGQRNETLRRLMDIAWTLSKRGTSGFHLSTRVAGEMLGGISAQAASNALARLRKAGYLIRTLRGSREMVEENGRKVMKASEWLCPVRVPSASEMGLDRGTPRRGMLYATRSRPPYGWTPRSSTLFR